MPRFIVQAEFKTGDAERDARGFFDRLKAGAADVAKAMKPLQAGGAAGGAAFDKTTEGAEKASSALLLLQARASQAKSQIAQIGTEIKTPAGINTIRKSLEDIRKEAIALEAESDAAFDPAGVKAYAAIVTQTTAQLEKLARAQRAGSAAAAPKPLNLGGAAATKELDAQAVAAKKAATEYANLRAALAAAKSDMSKIGVEIKTPEGIRKIHTELEQIRKDAIAYETAARAAFGTDLYNAKTVENYARTVTSATAAIEKLSAAQRSGAASAGGKKLTFGEDGNASAGLDRQAAAAAAAKRNYDALRVSLVATKSDIDKIGIEVKTPAGIEKIRLHLEGLRAQAVAYEAEAKKAFGTDIYNSKAVENYARLVSQTTAALDGLARSQRGASSAAGAKALGFGNGGDGGIPASYVQNIKALNTVFNDLERDRKNGIGSLEAYRQKLLQIQAVAQQRAGNTGLSDAERNLYARADKRAGTLINAGDTAEAKKLEGAITRVNSLLLSQKINSDQAGKALANLSARAGQLAVSTNVSNAAAETYLRTQAKINAAAGNLAGGDQGVVKARQAAAAQKLLTDQYRAGLIVSRQGESAAEAYGRQLLALATASKAAAQNSALSSAAQAEYTRTAAAAAAALERLKRAQNSRSGDTNDRDLQVAKATGDAQRKIATEYRAGTLARTAGETSAQSYRRQLEALITVTRAEAASTARSTAARAEFTRVAAASADALKRLRAEQTALSSGGSAAFALNSVAFGFGSVSALGTSFLTSALDLNEKSKMAAINIKATGDFYKLNAEGLSKAVKDTSDDIRLNVADVSQAFSYLVKAGFSAEAASVTIKRASDSAVGNALDANRAVSAVAQGVQQGRSVLLNTGGVEENIGPEIQKIARAVKKGEEYYRIRFLTNELARKEFDTNRKNGQSFNEAADAAGRYQFILRATAVDAGRTAQTVDTLTGQLNYFKTLRDTAKIGLLEGVSKVAVPVLKVGSATLKAFDSMPEWAKNTAGVAAAFTVLTGVLVAGGAALLAVSLQTKKVFVDSNILAGATARLTAANAALNTSYTATSFRLAAQAGLTNVYAASMVRLTGAMLATKAAATLLLATPVGLALTAGSTVVLGVANEYKKISQIYDDIAAADEDFNNKLVAQNGQEFVDKLNRLMTFLEVKGKFQKDLEIANDTNNPEAARAAEERIKRVDAVIASTRAEMAAIRAANLEKNGSASSTLEQAEAYRVLKEQLDAVSDRYGDMKLTGFQRDLRALEKEHARVMVSITKGEQEYISSEKTSGLTPEAAENLRKEAAQLIPNGIAGLVGREIEEARKGAAASRLEMERQQNELVKDGVEKRRGLLKLETRQTQDEYAERLKTVRANIKDPKLSPFEQGIGEDEKVKRTTQINEFVKIELDLLAERDAKIKALGVRSSAEIADIYRQRQRTLEDITRAGTEAQIRQLTALKTQLENSRTASLGTTGDDGGRLAIEQGFAAKSVALAERTARLQANVQRDEAQRAYEDSLVQAETLGTKKAQAEAEARKLLSATLGNIELETANTVTEARVAAEERVGQARTAVVESSLDLELANIGKIEGARLAALRRQYAREEQLARGRGEIETADAYREAVKGIDEEGATRLLNVTELLTKAREESEGLGAELVKLNGKAAKGLQAAQITAAQPFDAFIKARVKEREALVKAQENLISTDPSVTAAVDAQIRELNTFIQQATSGRIGAVQRAGADFAQVARDKAVKAAADTAEKLYDDGAGNIAAYQSALRTEKTYWDARLRGLDQGAADYDTQVETIRGRLESIRQAERDAILKKQEAAAKEAAKPLDRARSNVSLNEAQEGVARTDAARNRLILQRIGLLGKVSDLESKAAQSSLLSAEKRRELEIQSLITQGSALALRKQIDEATAANAKSLTDLAAAQVDYAVAVGRSDAGVTAAIEERLGLTRQQITTQDGLIKSARVRGDGEAVINGLKVERLNLLGRELAQEKELSERPLKLAGERLAQEKELSGLYLERGGLRDNEVAQARLALQYAERELELAREKLALARSQGTDEDVRGAVVAVAQGENAVLKNRNALIKAPLADEQRRLGLLNAQARSLAAQSGLADDAVTQARLKVQAAEQELRAADALVAAAQTQVELQGALTQQADARAGLIAAEQAAFQATTAAVKELQTAEVARQSAYEQAAQSRVTLARAALEAALKQAEVQAVINNLSGDGVANAQRELSANRARLSQVQDLTGGSNLTTDARTGLLREQVDLIAQIAEGERRVAKAQLDAGTQALDLVDARRRATAQILGQGDDAVGSARLELELAQNRLSLLEGAASSPALGQTERAALYRDELNLLGQIADAQRKVGEAEKARARLQTELAFSADALRREAQGGNAERNAFGNAVAALTLARQRAGLAADDLVAAQASGNLERVRGATDALTGAITQQRTASSALAETYRTVLSNMEAVRSASQALRDVVNPEGANFNAGRERERFNAIQVRRDAAATALGKALKEGDNASIAAATQELAAQEKRYRDQAKLLKDKGQSVTLTGDAYVKQLSDQVDKLGIQYDRENAAAESRARTARTEAEAAFTFASAADGFAGTTAELLAGLDTFGQAAARVTPAQQELLNRADRAAANLEAPALTNPALLANLRAATSDLQAAIVRGGVEAGDVLAKALIAAAPAALGRIRQFDGGQQAEAAGRVAVPRATGATLGGTLSKIMSEGFTVFDASLKGTLRAQVAQQAGRVAELRDLNTAIERGGAQVDPQIVQQRAALLGVMNSVQRDYERQGAQQASLTPLNIGKAVASATARTLQNTVAFQQSAAPSAYRENVVRTDRAAPSVTNNYTYNTTNEATVYAAQGQSPDQIADGVIRKLEDRARRQGRNC